MFFLCIPHQLLFQSYFYYSLDTQFLTLARAILFENGLDRSDDRFFSLRNGLHWAATTNVLLIRDCWKRLRDLLETQLGANVIINGKAGRGKSVFLLYLIFDIIFTAIERRKRDDGAIAADEEHLKSPLIVFVQRNGTKFLISVDTVELLNSPVSPHYYVSDNIDVSHGNVGSILTICATSGDADSLKEFNKRRAETSGPTYTMPSLELNEMKLIFCGHSDEELQFKFDIFGGNPRVFSDNCGSFTQSKYYSIVRNALHWLFGDDFVPQDDDECCTARQHMGAWAINIIVDRLESASPSTNTDSSLFKHYLVDEKCVKKMDCFVSTSLFFIAAALDERFGEAIMSSLKKLFGASGIGNAFEMTAHKNRLASNELHFCFKEDGKIVELPLGGRPKVLVRTIADLSQLKVGEYGFPTICNFPLVDAVLPPDIALNMTIGNSHKGAALKLAQITQAMGINTNQLKLVFIVPQDVIGSFQFPRDLGDAQLFLTTPDYITEVALAALRPISKKRKSSGLK